MFFLRHTVYSEIWHNVQTLRLFSLLTCVLCLETEWSSAVVINFTKLRTSTVAIRYPDEHITPANSSQFSVHRPCG